MRVAILGAGAMGSWFGGQLAMQGHDVQLLTTNSAHINAVCSHGLEMQTQTKDSQEAPVRSCVELRICQPDMYDGAAELIIILTKCFQTGAALSVIADRLHDDTAVLSLQNGLGNAECLARFVTADNIWIGMSMMPVDRLAPGIIASRGQGQTRFGHLGGRFHPFGDQIVAAFAGTGMDVKHDPCVIGKIWEKVAFNAGMNALSALTRGTPGSVGQLREGIVMLHSIASEVALVAAAEGVVIELDRVFATIDFACANHGAHKPSMRQDLEAGRRTEVEALNGAIVRLGERHAIATPLNAALATLVRIAELGDHAL